MNVADLAQDEPPPRGRPIPSSPTQASEAIAEGAALAQSSAVTDEQTIPPGKVIDTGAISHQKLLAAGINAFAVELLSESFHTSALLKAFPDNPVSFTWDGVSITLQRVGEPRHPRIRQELGLPVAGAAEALSAGIDAVTERVRRRAVNRVDDYDEAPDANEIRSAYP